MITAAPTRVESAALTAHADNLAAVRSSYAAFGRGDLDGALAMMDEGTCGTRPRACRTVASTGLPRCAPRCSTRSTSCGGRTSTPCRRRSSAGTITSSRWRYTGRAKGTGKPLDVPFAHVWRFEGGKAVRFHQFTDTRGWVDALTT